MPSKLTSIAKILIALCLVIGLASSYFSRRYLADADYAQSYLAQEQLHLQKANQDLRTLQRSVRLSAGVQQAPALSDAVTRVMLGLYGAQVDCGVTLNAVGAGLQNSPGLVDYLRVAQRIGNTHASKIPVHVSGHFASYTGFLQYVHTLQKLPLSLSYIKVQGHAFNLRFDIVGVTQHG
jgi:hypothetical protein